MCVVDFPGDKESNFGKERKIRDHALSPELPSIIRLLKILDTSKEKRLANAE